MHINTLHLEGLPVDFIAKVALEIINSYLPGYKVHKRADISNSIWANIYDCNGTFVGMVNHDTISEKRSVTFFAYSKDKNNCLDFDRFLFNFCIYY